MKVRVLSSAQIKWLLASAGLILLAALVIRGQIARRAVAPPRHLADAGAAALRETDDRHCVTAVAHLETSGGLDFAPPNLPTEKRPAIFAPDSRPSLTDAEIRPRRTQDVDVVRQAATPVTWELSPGVRQAPPELRRLPLPSADPYQSLPETTNRPATTLSASSIRPPVPPAAPAVAPLIKSAGPTVPRRSLEWQRQMWPVAQRADEQIREAFETCGRGAMFAGRSEMIQALRSIAQNADSLAKGSEHSDALAAGLRALSEAESFAPRGSRLEGELDLAKLIESHRTPVLREALAGPERGRKITALEAQNRYFAYAQQQLSEATAGLPVGAIALYGLGKIHLTLSTADTDARAVEEPRAMALFQAAMIADPGNPLAAHEMGVLLARNQRYDEALAMLQHSARIALLPETWRNLAIVHTKRGEADMAKRANQEAVNAQARLTKAKPASHPALARGSVRWVKPEEFAQTRTGEATLNPAATKSMAPPKAAAALKSEEKPSGVFSWLPWTAR